MKKIVPIAIITLVLAIGVFVSSAQAGTSSLTGWAWSSNIGWVSFNGANAGASGGSYSVKISTSTPNGSDGVFLGHAWSPHIGWISFNRAETGNPPSEDIISSPGSTDPIAKIDMSTGAVTGWARALTSMADPNDGWDGWIHLSGTSHETDTNLTGTAASTKGVSFNKANGLISGYAWGSDVIGWLQFNLNCPTCNGSITGTPSCTVTPTSVGNNSISLTYTVLNDSGQTYTLTRNPAFSSNPTKNITSATFSASYDDTGLSPGQYSYTLARSGGASCSSVSVTVTGTTAGSTGLRLLIAKSTVPNADLDVTNLTKPYDDNALEYQDISIKSGDQFKLKWNVDPALKTAGYNLCSGTVDSPTGPTGTWGNNINGGLTLMNTGSGVSGNQFTFTLTCTISGLSPKTSTAKLYIINSSIRER